MTVAETFLPWLAVGLLLVVCSLLWGALLQTKSAMRAVRLELDYIRNRCITDRKQVQYLRRLIRSVHFRDLKTNRLLPQGEIPAEVLHDLRSL